MKKKKKEMATCYRAGAHLLPGVKTQEENKRPALKVRTITNTFQLKNGDEDDDNNNNNCDPTAYMLFDVSKIHGDSTMNSCKQVYSCITVLAVVTIYTILETVHT